eukprot:gene3494-biopygen3434
MLHKPQQPLAQPLQPFMLALLQHQHRKQRHQADDRTQPHRLTFTARTMQHVIEKLILLIPQAVSAIVNAVDRPGDVQEVLKELHRDIHIHDIALGQLQTDTHQVQRVRRNPRCAVRLVQLITRRQISRAIEQRNVVQPKKSALEQVAALGVLTVNPPGKIQQQLVEDPLQEIHVAHAIQRLVLLIHPPTGPGMHRRVGVVKTPLVGRQLTVGVHEAVFHQQQQLLLGVTGVDQGNGHRLEPLVPGGIPRIFPGVGHRENVEIRQVPPMGIADMQTLGRRRGLGRIAVEPLIHVEVVQLLGPQQPRQSLALHVACVFIGDVLLQRRVEIISLLTAFFEQLARIDPRRLRRGEAQVQGFAFLARQFQDETRGHFRARIPANRRFQARSHIVVDPVLERPRRRLPVQPGVVGFVLAEQPFHPVLAPGTEVAIEQLMVPRHHLFALQAQLGPGRIVGPTPVVARPQVRQHLQACGLVRTVVHGNAHEHIIGLVLGVFDGDIAIAVVFENPGIEDLVFGISKATAGVLGDQVIVGKGRVRVFVEHAHVGMARHAIDEKVQFLDVFAVVALGVVQAEQAFLDDRVALVPQRQAQAPALGLVAEARQAILAPAVGAAAGMFVGEVAPGIAVGAVVFAHRAPLPLAQVGAPVTPALAVRLGQALAFNRFQNVRRRLCRHRVFRRVQR